MATNLPIAAENIDGLAQWAAGARPDLTVVGPEAPLCAGLVDRFEKLGLRVFGPRQAAARLEGSKQFAKEVMQAAGVPTAILSRQVAVIRGKSLIVNLPGQPKAIRETLEGLKAADGTQKVHGIFAAIPYCLDLIGAPYVETHESVCKAFRPKSARRG